MGRSKNKAGRRKNSHPLSLLFGQTRAEPREPREGDTLKLRWKVEGGAVDYAVGVKLHYLAGELYDWITDPRGFEKLFHWARARTALKMVRQLEKTPSISLDVGCGTGLITRYLRSSNVIGVDINRWNLDRAKRRISHADFVQCDAEHLPFRRGSVDLVVCTEVLEHLLAPEKALLEIYSVLGVDGKLVGSVPSDSALWRLRGLLSVTHPKSEPFHRNYAHEQLEKLLSEIFAESAVSQRNFLMNLFFVAKRAVQEA